MVPSVSAEEMNSQAAARKPLSTDKAAGLQGRFVIGEAMDEAVGELGREVQHEAAESDDGGEEQETTCSASACCDQRLSDGRLCGRQCVVQFSFFFTPPSRESLRAQLTNLSVGVRTQLL
jgi:hypothetical protein